MAKGAAWPKHNEPKENEHALSTNPIPSTSCTSIQIASRIEALILELDGPGSESVSSTH